MVAAQKSGRVSSTNRFAAHKLPDGRAIPGTFADPAELVEIARAVAPRKALMQAGGVIACDLPRRPLVPVLGGPETRIAMVHAVDAADAVAALARPGGPRGETFALSDGVTGYRWDMILDNVAQAMGRSPPRVAIPHSLLRAVGLIGNLRAALTGRRSACAHAGGRLVGGGLDAEPYLRYLSGKLASLQR